MPACRSWSTARPTIRWAPAELASWLERFVAEDGVNLIGGCCGTNVAHIAALDAMLRRRGGVPARPGAAHSRSGCRPSPSLYQPVPLRQENAFFAIGERCNANGSKKWRELQEAARLGRLRRDGPRAGAAKARNALDICTAFVGRDEMAEMTEVIRRFTASVNAPLVIDSTETPVIEAALKLHGGKPIINSINFEDGEGHAADRLMLAKQLRRRGDRADHRRDRHGQDRRGASSRSRAGWSISPATGTACRSPTC